MEFRKNEINKLNKVFIFVTTSMNKKIYVKCSLI